MVDLLEIIKRKDIAARNGYWLESLSLAHLFVETQLELIVSGHCSPDEVDKASRRHVWGLANLAKRKGLITPDTWNMIEEFNSARNKAIHGLATGEITYKDIEQHALDVDDLIANLQSYYVIVIAGPEMRIDE
jgi:hypothetical protein